MYYSAVHPFISFSDDVGYRSCHSVVSKKSSEGLPINAIELLIVIVDRGRANSTLGLFHNDTHGCDMIRHSKAGSLVTEMRVYYIFHSVLQNAIEHLSWDGHDGQRDFSEVGAGTEEVLFGVLYKVSLFSISC